MSSDNNKLWRGRRWVVAVAAAAVVVASVAWWPRRTQDAVTTPAASREGGSQAESGEPPLDSAGYLGMEACARCHAERVAEFQRTNHVRTCRVPRVAEMPAAFAAGEGTFVSQHPGLQFEMGRSGDVFFQTALHDTPLGQQRTTTRIDLVYGAGTADDVYLAWHDDGRMYELPMAWLHTSDQWGVTHVSPHGEGDFSRPLTPRCLECHNTWFHHVPGTANQYDRRQYILGVTCERCHGPGREHVAYHDAHPDAASGRAIVNPASLERERLIEVCTQCHGNSITFRGPAFSYRPGEPLEKYYRSLSVERTEDDHVANQIACLRQSRCFQHSDSLTCTTCHDPHRPSGPDDSPASSCLECHQADHCTDQGNLPAAVRDDCVGCHMPQYVKINVNFQTAADDFVPPIRRYQHRIAVHPAARQEVLLRWHRQQPSAESQDEAARLEEALVAHWLAEADKHREQHRLLAVVADLREALRLRSSPELQEKLREAVAAKARHVARWSEASHLTSANQHVQAIAVLQDILKIKPDDAKAHGRLGAAYAHVGQRRLAVEHLQKAAQYDPDDAYGYGMLAWLAYLDGQPEEALKYYRLADEIEPYDAKIHHNMALALVDLGQLPEAMERFRQALVIDPKRVDTCQCLGLALADSGQLDEAIGCLERAAGLTSQGDLKVLGILAEMCSAAGRFREAADATARALELAKATQPALVPELSRRLDALRERASQASP